MNKITSTKKNGVYMIRVNGNQSLYYTAKNAETNQWELFNFDEEVVETAATKKEILALVEMYI